MLSENIRMALSSIRAARFRSFLTMLGIIIGVVSVITIVSLGEGIKREVSGHGESAGKDLIIVRPGKLVKRDNNGNINGLNLLSFLSSSSLTEEDLAKITGDPNVSTAVPFSVISGAPTIDKEQYNDGFIIATTEKMPQVIAQETEFGNFFDEGDKNRRVAIIGFGVAEKLFKENVPIGKNLQLRGHNFVVGGVLERTQVNPLAPETDFNNGVFIPYETGRFIAGDKLQTYEILVRPKDKTETGVDKTISSISNNLKNNHGGQEDFTVLRQEEMLSVTDSILKLVTGSVTIMAAVALFVGGIGIMNVMLVSVTERTREIGIRKAVGATNHQIQVQFLIEAIVISLWGAIVGIVLSGVINLLFRIFTNLQPVITWQVVLMAAAISTLIGVVFGMIPAMKAARKDPIEALRTY